MPSQSRDTSYRYKGRPLYLQFGQHLELGVSVLAADVWAYVDHSFAKRKGTTQCRQLWRQAQHFAQDLSTQPYSAQPLSLYYAMLNATKAMLLCRNPPPTPHFGSHGISYVSPLTVPARSPGPMLDWEVIVRRTGVFRNLCAWMGDQTNTDDRHALIDLLRQVIGVHRAFCTATDERERFVPLDGQMRLHEEPKGTFFFRSSLPVHIKKAAVGGPTHLSVDFGTRMVRTPDVSLSRSDRDFKQKLISYHAECRRKVVAIYGRDRTSQYFRPTATPTPDWSQISLNFAIGMALSSLARYHPEDLERLYEHKMGWVVKEYLRTALTQYIALVAAEITGRVIQQPFAGM